MEDLNHLRDRVFKMACDHGFKEEEQSYEHQACLVIAELMNAVQSAMEGNKARREDFEARMNQHDPQFKFKVEFEHWIVGSFEDTLADVCIRLLKIAGQYDFDCKIVDKYEGISPSLILTENIYNVVRNITDYRMSINGRIHRTISQLFDLATLFNIDLIWFVEKKLEYIESKKTSNAKTIKKET